MDTWNGTDITQRCAWRRRCGGGQQRHWCRARCPPCGRTRNRPSRRWAAGGPWSAQLHPVTDVHCLCSMAVKPTTAAHVTPITAVSSSDDGHRRGTASPQAGRALTRHEPYNGAPHFTPRSRTLPFPCRRSRLSVACHKWVRGNELRAMNVLNLSEVRGMPGSRCGRGRSLDVSPWRRLVLLAVRERRAHGFAGLVDCPAQAVSGAGGEDSA
jgi:hypothetical protein